MSTFILSESITVLNFGMSSVYLIVVSKKLSILSFFH